MFSPTLWRYSLQREGLWDKFCTDAPARQRQRRAIQHSQESLNALAEQFGINLKTVAEWKKRAFANDAPMGP